ncbi:MAG: carboxypeptidase-like regulatory domain-containing protein [Bacteroidales bacterium]|nr:carboxypeptidase-like regulatory domain-containing protein [Bacteroidales bacterium]
MKKNELKNVVRFLVAITLIIHYSPVFSQCKIVGTIKAENNQAVQFANIFIMPENSQEIIAFCSSDENGNYELATNKIGKFNLTFSALSFKKLIVPVEIKVEDKRILENIILASQPLELKEVVVSRDRAVIMKKDTVVFNASSFLQGNEQVVEDLLRKLPGLSVSKDGVITVGNQEVEKVMIEGDDFFEKGYKMLTKNMPVSPVNKIELLSHYSNNKLLKGIEKTDKVALNIKLKDKAKQQWFGNLSLGYGLDNDVNNRYNIQSNLMNFSKKNKFYFFSNLNNTGDKYDGYIENLIHQFNTDDEANMGDKQSAYSFLSLNGYTPNLDSKRVNLNDSKILSLNDIYVLSPKIKIKFIGLLNSEKNDFYRNIYKIF